MVPEIPVPAKQISKAVVKAQRVSETITHIVISIIIMVLFGLDEHFQWADWAGWIIIGLGGFTVFSAIWSIVFGPILLQRHWRYDVNEDYVQLKHGAMIEKHVTIPMTKVQSVKLKQGPIQRKYGLCSIEIGTMGTTHTIPGVSEKEAKPLRDKIAYFARIKEVET